MQNIQDRMPVIVPREGYFDWLGGDKPPDLLKPYPADEMEAHRVSTLVNKPSNLGPELIEPGG